MADHRTWKVVREDGSVDAYYDGKDPDEELLAELLTRWSRDLLVSDWDDRALFAALCAEKTNISTREAAGMVGLTPDDVESVTIPPGPPWTLSHPTESDKIRIIRETGFPDPKSW